MKIKDWNLFQHLKSRNYFDSELLVLNQDSTQERLWIGIFDSSELMEEILGEKEKSRRYAVRYVFFLFEEVSNVKGEILLPNQAVGAELHFLAVNQKSLVINQFTAVQIDSDFVVEIEFDRKNGTISFCNSNVSIFEVELFSRQVGDEFKMFQEEEGGVPIEEGELLKTFYHSPDELGAWLAKRSRKDS